MAERTVQGNGSRAVAVLEPDVINVGDRALNIRKKSEELNGLAYIDDAVTKIAVAAVDRVERIVQSPDEQVALRASMFVIDHARGKAVQRTENKNYNLNIQSVLE